MRATYPSATPIAGPPTVHRRVPGRAPPQARSASRRRVVGVRGHRRRHDHHAHRPQSRGPARRRPGRARLPPDRLGRDAHVRRHAAPSTPGSTCPGRATPPRRWWRRCASRPCGTASTGWCSCSTATTPLPAERVSRRLVRQLPRGRDRGGRRAPGRRPALVPAAPVPSVGAGQRRAVRRHRAPVHGPGRASRARSPTPRATSSPDARRPTTTWSPAWRCRAGLLDRTARRAGLGASDGAAGTSGTARSPDDEEAARLLRVRRVRPRRPRRRLGELQPRTTRGTTSSSGPTCCVGRPTDLAGSAAAVLGLAAWLAGHGALAWCAVDRAAGRRPGLLAGPAGRRPAVARRCHRRPGRRCTACATRPDLSPYPAFRAYCSCMGEEVDAQEFTRADRTRHREKVRRCLDVFARMLREARFDTDDPMTGLEVELNLVDDDGDPALKNAEALETIADPRLRRPSSASSTSRSTCRPAQAPRGRAHDVRGRPAHAASTTPRPSPARSAPTW